MKYLLVALILLVSVCTMAQNNTGGNSGNQPQTRRERNAEKKKRLNEKIAQEEDGALVYQKQNLFGVKLNTDGLGFIYEHGIYKTITRTNIWWIELGEKKARNQDRVTPDPQIINGGTTTIISAGNSYIFGKENNFYPLNIGFGRQKLIGNKGTTNGVSVTAIYGGGISLGLLKPYYVQIQDSLGNLQDIKYSDNPNAFLDPGSILGASGFATGLAEIKIIPGLHTRAALRFDYGRYRDVLSALEVGINLNYYANKIAILALNNTQNLFFNAYIAIEFGKRR